MIHLQNQWLKLQLDPEIGSFSLCSTADSSTGFGLTNVALELAEIPSLKVQKLTDFLLEESSLATQLTNFGRAEIFNSTYTLNHGALRMQLELGLSQELPLLLEKISLTNLADSPIFPHRIILGSLSAGQIQFSDQPAHPAFYSNGWQSWSPSGTYSLGQRQQRTRLGVLSHPMLYNPGTPVTHAKNHFSSDMFGLLADHQSKLGLLVGFLSQHNQFGSLETRLKPSPSLSIWANCDQVLLAPGKTLQTDWAVWQFVHLDDPQPFSIYFSAAAKENQVRPRLKTPLGWCSWYYYFTKVTADDVRKNLHSITNLKSQLPLDLVQIDDGYQIDVGTWLETNSKFPDGMAPLSQEIDSAECTPGLWLAPFILEQKSELVKKHPDWLLKNSKGKPVRSGFVWNNLGYALDLTHPEASNYVRKVIKNAVENWGYRYLKLDFLYAAALAGNYSDPTLTRAQVLHQSLKLIRQEAGSETTLLGCGCPIGSAIGIMDMMRISADVSPDWHPTFLGISKPFKKEPNMPCARNAIQNILTRAPMDPYFWVNDPDCLLVREDSNLSKSEVQSLATVIAMTGGALILSDDMTQLDPERIRIAQALIPSLSPGPQLPDLFKQLMPAQLLQNLSSPCGDWPLLALFNWSDQQQDLTFSLQDLNLTASENYLIREFWTGQIAQTQETHTFFEVPPHGVCLVAVKKIEQEPVYLGSDAHISQGLEVKSWRWFAPTLDFTLDFVKQTKVKLYIYTTSSPSQVLQDGLPVSSFSFSSPILELALNIHQSSQLTIHF